MAILWPGWVTRPDSVRRQPRDATPHLAKSPTREPGRCKFASVELDGEKVNKKEMECRAYSGVLKLRMTIFQQLHQSKNDQPDCCSTIASSTSNRFEMGDLQLKNQLPIIARSIKSGGKLFEKYRSKRGYAVNADEQLQELLNSGPRTVQSPYNKLVNRLGEPFASGDG